jgi:Chromo (CHRromatin Organisation MOdifier) domain
MLCFSNPILKQKCTDKTFLPVPDILDGEEIYNVEMIHRKRGRSYQYLIKWEGYPIFEASWELETAFSDDGNLLSTYKQRHQL